MADWPFHPGELEAQERAGGGPPGAGIRDFMTPQHREFFQALPYLVVAVVDQRWPSATLLAGRPGFISAPDPYTLRVAARLDLSDPSHAALVAGRPAGVLGIDLATRRRNRENGVIAAAGATGFTLDVQQSFGNCPKYIHLREVHPTARTPGAVEFLPTLDDDARAAIASADTFFVATAARTSEMEGGVDISHRGGPAGFAQLRGDTLTIPDFRGNRYFNTLGNMVSDPHSALLFVDFTRGDLLHLQGQAEIVWDGPVAGFEGAERLWRIQIERAWRKRAAVPLSWLPASR